MPAPVIHRGVSGGHEKVCHQTISPIDFGAAWQDWEGIVSNPVGPIGHGRPRVADFATFGNLMRPMYTYLI
jgi:hypothetical protein